MNKKIEAYVDEIGTRASKVIIQLLCCALVTILPISILQNSFDNFGVNDKYIYAAKIIVFLLAFLSCTWRKEETLKSLLCLLILLSIVAIGLCLIYLTIYILDEIVMIAFYDVSIDDILNKFPRFNLNFLSKEGNDTFFFITTIFFILASFLFIICIFILMVFSYCISYALVMKYIFKKI
jgi:hypothetical protein